MNRFWIEYILAGKVIVSFWVESYTPIGAITVAEHRLDERVNWDSVSVTHETARNEYLAQNKGDKTA